MSQIHSLNWGAWVRAHTRERENSCWRSSFCLWVLLFPLVLILSLRKLRGFLLYSFIEVNSLCLLSLVIIIVHVILLDKILRSYFLNDKNLIFQICDLSFKDHGSPDQRNKHIRRGTMKNNKKYTSEYISKLQIHQHSLGHQNRRMWGSNLQHSS